MLRPHRLLPSPPGPPPSFLQRYPRFITGLGVYLLCLAVYLMSSSGHFSSTDHVSVYLTTQSLIEHGNLAIKPINDTMRGPDGRFYGVFGLGQSVASIPLYLLGRTAEHLASPWLRTYWSGANLGDWGGTVPIHFVSLFNQFLTPLTCVLVFLFGIELGYSRLRSLFLTLAFSFGTATWVYAKEYFQHPLESLCLLTTVYLLFSHRQQLQPRHALWAGLALALGILTRVNLLLLVPLLASYLVLLLREHGRSYLPPLLTFFAPIGLVLLAWLAVNQARFGNYLAFNPTVARHGFDSPILLGLYGNLLSPGRGLFWYSPPLILALFAFHRFQRERPLENLLFIALTGTYLLFYSAYGDWSGGWCWGPRFLVPVIPFLTLPLGYLVGRNGWALALGLLVVLGILVQILGLTVNYSYVYWDWARMKLSPDTAFLWVPEISAIPTHLHNLLAGRHLDIWWFWVYQNYGWQVLLATLALPLLLLSGALVLLIRNRESTHLDSTS